MLILQGNKVETLSRYTITLDDDPLIAKVVSRMTGITSLPFTSIEALLKRAHSYQPVAAFVDVNLEEDDCGLDAITQLRKKWKFTPIIVITSDERDTLIGQALALGANDFLRKPLHPSELIARLHARIDEMTLRQKLDTITIADLEFSVSRMSLQKGCQVAHLPRLETQMLLELFEKRDMLVSRDAIKRRIWGRVNVSENTLDKKISQIRVALKAIGANVIIESHYGKGFMLRAATKPSIDVI